MSAGVIRLPAEYPYGYVNAAGVRNALQEVRKAIANGGYKYVCVAASGLYTWSLREWVREILRDCCIRTDGAGFVAHNCPDWLLEFNAGDDAASEKARRVHFLDCVIEALK